MSRTPYLIAASVAALFAASAAAGAQASSAARPHVIVVKLAVKAGSAPYTFEPANVVAARGDTLRFVDEEAVPHNVHFKTHPSGAKLGGIAVGPYVTSKGQTYDVVIDSRCTDGKYEFVCDPHEMLGMKGVLTVDERTVAANVTK